MNNIAADSFGSKRVVSLLSSRCQYLAGWLVITLSPVKQGLTDTVNQNLGHYLINR